MKITAIRAYQVDLPLLEGSYKWSGGNSVSVFDSTVVEVVTDTGRSGWGEVCPLGPAYLPAYANGARTGIAELAPHLIGMDPLGLGEVNRRMDAAMRGHPYVKAPIDMACWALLGQEAGLSGATLMGGHVGERFALGPRELPWILAAAAGIQNDLAVKTLCAPAYGRFLRRLLAA